MTFIATAAASAAIAFCTLVPGCAPSHNAAPAVKPACQGAIVVIAAGADMDCDMTPPQRLDALYDAKFRADWPSTDAVQAAAIDCDNSGGELIDAGNPDAFVCEGIDY